MGNIRQIDPSLFQNPAEINTTPTQKQTAADVQNVPAFQPATQGQKFFDQITKTGKSFGQGTINKFGEISKEFDSRKASPFDITTLAFDIMTKGAEVYETGAEFIANKVQSVEPTARELLEGLSLSDQAASLGSLFIDIAKSKDEIA